MTIEYHEPPEELKPETRDVHRALATLCEELEAIDWYQHRIDVTQEESLRDLFEHNRNEEMEHAAMTLEWLRRTLPSLDEQLKQYLFTEGPVVRPKGVAEAESNGGLRSLEIGSLRTPAQDRKKVS